MPQYAYSPSEIRALLRARAEGLTYKQIARITREFRRTTRTPEALRTWFQRYYRDHPEARA